MNKYNSYESKLRWAKSLKVGDIVEDCNYKRQKITEIIPKYGPNMHNPINRILCELMLYTNKLDWWDNLMRSRYILGFSSVYDVYLVFENNTGCEAMPCCDVW